jgi:hypothetical protein
LQHVEGKAAFKQFAVNKYGRCGLDTKFAGQGRFVLHLAAETAGIEASVKCVLIQAHSAGHDFERVGTEGSYIFTALVGENRVVVGPKLPLFIGTFGRFGRAVRFCTDKSEMSIFKTDLTRFCILFF